ALAHATTPAEVTAAKGRALAEQCTLRVHGLVQRLRGKPRKDRVEGGA
nr:hypothetical protein [Planctomycetota bacterium]